MRRVAAPFGHGSVSVSRFGPGGRRSFSERLGFEAMISGELRKWLSFGTGVGIEIRDDDLVATTVHVRPGGVRVLAFTTISRFRERPAAEWGAEYQRFVKAVNCAHVAATVLLPRDEVIVRQIAMPGVTERDLADAIRYQVDSLHPYPEDEVSYGWARVPGSSVVVIGIARTPLIDRYITLFSEAGIRTASFTFSAAMVYSGIRTLRQPPPEGFLLLEKYGEEWEAYGESPARPLFSAAFDMPPEKVADLVGAELRLPPDTETVRLADLLPAPQTSPEGWELASSAGSYMTALAGACPWLSLSANLLPESRRTNTSLLVYAPTAALLAMLVIALAAMAVASGMGRRGYEEALRKEIARFTPEAAKVREVEQEIERIQARRNLLREFKTRTKRDLDALLDLTNLLEPPAFLRTLQMTRANATLSGETPAADKLIEILDDSPLFRNSEYMSPIANAGQMQSFTIRLDREIAELPPPAEAAGAGTPPVETAAAQPRGDGGAQ